MPVQSAHIEWEPHTKHCRIIQGYYYVPYPSVLPETLQQSCLHPAAFRQKAQTSQGSWAKQVQEGFYFSMRRSKGTSLDSRFFAKIYEGGDFRQENFLRAYCSLKHYFKTKLSFTICLHSASCSIMQLFMTGSTLLCFFFEEEKRENY